MARLTITAGIVRTTWYRAAVLLALGFMATSWYRGPAAVADEPKTHTTHFESQVVPVLATNCLGCHNGSEAAGGLDLTSGDAIARGGDSGKVIEPGDAADSFLWQRVADGEMPPEDSGLTVTAEQLAELSAWIDAGAVWPDGRVLSPFEFTTDRRAGLDWWSLAAPVRPEVPDVAAAAWVRNPIDAFIASRLEQAGLAPSPKSSRATLLRRAKLDLLGLPPTPDEIARFTGDTSPAAYEDLIDRLLASPHYGERWGRHWLDVVRFGETNGYETNTPRANAWPYRDWVIRSLIEDMPYDRFVMAQLAGDQLGADVATGFLVGGSHDIVGIAEPEGQMQQRVNDLDDMIRATSEAFLGLSVGCAKCHDHKFDAISQHDYYALQAVFAGVFHGERGVPADDHQQRLKREPKVRRQLAEIERELLALQPLATLNDTPAPRRSPVSHLKNVDRFTPASAKRVRFTVFNTNASEPCLDELEVYSADDPTRNVALASDGARATASGVYADGGSAIHQLAHVNDGQYGNPRSWISDQPGAGWVEIEFPQTIQIDRVEWSRDRQDKFKDRVATEYRIEVAVETDAWQLVATSADRAAFDPQAGRSPDAPPLGLGEAGAAHYKSLLARRSQLQSQLPAAGMQTVYAGEFRQPEPTHRLHRGEPMQKREQIAPGSIASVGQPFQLSGDEPEPKRRLALARWIASPENPLTARVIVNRLWHYHFGRGLVDTPGDFGWHGGQPSHPELLDWLATELVRQGWSLKTMHRLVMLSATYRQSSRPDHRAAAVDADVRLLWRFPPRRLEAEPLRDSILAASGRLDLTAGGPGYDAFEPNDNYVHVYIPRKSFGPAEWRRMVYQTKPRMEQDATFGAFDCPDASGGVHRRNVSTTALQALNLLNSPFVIQQAGFFAERLTREAGADVDDQVRLAFMLAFARRPSENETAAAAALIAEHGLPIFCRALYNANEFVYVE